MKKTWIRLVSLVIATLLVMTGLAMAEGEPTAEVIFSANEKDGGIVELDVTVKNAKFMVVQAALGYDASVVVPIAESGDTAVEVGDFEIKTEVGKLLSAAGTKFDSSKGLFGFAYFVMPGTDNEKITDKGEFVAGTEGELIRTFRFKRIAEGDLGFSVVLKSQTDFVAAVEQGISLMDYDSELPLKVRYYFEYNGKKTGETVEIEPVIPPAKPEKEPEFTSTDRKKDVICLQIGKPLAVSKDQKSLIDTGNKQVVPYISNDRTMVPIRFVAESLGAEVVWEEGWSYCIIKKGDKEIKLNFNSTEFEVDGVKVESDAPIEITQDRTMVPIRFVSEQLGCDVHWNEKNRAVVITPADNPWIADREAEITALNEMLIAMSGILP